MKRTIARLALAGLLATGLLVTAAGSLQAQTQIQTAKQFFACYVPATGTVYLIKQPGLRSECASGHVQFSWSGGGSGLGVAPAVVITDPDGWAATGTFGSGVIPVTGAGVRVMWYPRKAAFRAGRVTGNLWDDANVGNQSFAMGINTTASGSASTATGVSTTASGHNSTALGSGTTASGSWSTAMGQNTTASAINSTALGLGTTANSDVSTAIGDHTMASGAASTAMGNRTTASGDFSTSMGDRAVATDVGSTAMGILTTASGSGSTAMGENTRASGTRSTAMGWSTTASFLGSTALGIATTASSGASTAMGQQTTASGAVSTAMGIYTTASGDNSTAMGTFASTNLRRGSFVYGDGSTTGTLVQATADNSFVVRAQRVWIGKSGDQVATAGRYIETSTGAYLSDGGVWTNVSDATRKENFREEDAAAVLENVGHLLIRSWNYKAEDPSIRHLGPTGQDFYAAFHLGDTDKAIGTVDEAGVALLSIQALERRTREQAREIEALRAELAALQAEMAQPKQ